MKGFERNKNSGLSRTVGFFTHSCIKFEWRVSQNFTGGFSGK